ncbi:dTMP kinase [Candidatus Woesearchaeota archaeon]|nr:dTMP kinase [Candidatus Woesearchaeota archaeon]
MQGKLIVIEGSDGSGKKTQVDLLLHALHERNIKVAVFDFPQYDSFYGKIIAKYLRGEFGDLQQTNPYFVALPYALDRLAAKEKIQTALNQGYMVICNRYVPSNQAHQAAKFVDQKQRDAFIRWVDELEFVQNQMPRPDITIYLHLPDTFNQVLVDKKPARDYIADRKRDIHEADRDYLHTVEGIYLQLAQQMGWKIIECVVEGELFSPQIIHRHLLQVLDF